jgi:hypothetical protein
LWVSWALACSFDPNAGVGASVDLGDTGDSMGSDTRATRPMLSNGDADSDANSESTAADPETSGPPPVECDGGNGVCVADVPDGWTGPLVVGRWGADDTPLTCPAGWPMAASGGIGITALPATCGCNCTPTVGSCIVEYAYYTSFCALEIDSGTTTGPCSSEYSSSNPEAVRATATAQGSSCAGALVPTIPEAVWSQHVLGCKPAELGTCGDGPCMPAAPADFDERYCIMAPGDNLCPAGPYVARSVAHSEMHDTRGCSPCECTTSAVCSGTLREYNDSGCSSQAGTVATDGSCHSSALSGGGYYAVAWMGGPPNVMCTPNSPAPTGETTASNAMTFCCVP